MSRLSPTLSSVMFHRFFCHQRYLYFLHHHHHHQHCPTVSVIFNGYYYFHHHHPWHFLTVSVFINDYYLHHYHPLHCPFVSVIIHGFYLQHYQHYSLSSTVITLSSPLSSSVAEPELHGAASFKVASEPGRSPSRFFGWSELRAETGAAFFRQLLLLLDLLGKQKRKVLLL